MAVLLGRLKHLRLEIAEAHRRDEKAATVLLDLPLIVYHRRHNLVHAENGELLDLHRVQVGPEDELRDRMNVVGQVLVEE